MEYIDTNIKAKTKIRRASATAAASATALICAAVLIFFTLSAAFSLRADFEIYENVLRLHVIANSDSESDQALKIKVRDAVLIASEEIFRDCKSISEAEEAVELHRDELISASERVIAESGADYGVTLTLGREYYPTRTYDGVSLPCGYYSSLRIIIGEGNGHNWWCILFPTLCTRLAIASSTEESESTAESDSVAVVAEVDTPSPEIEFRAVGFTENQISLLTEQENPKYILRFRIVELIGELFGRLNAG